MKTKRNSLLYAGVANIVIAFVLIVMAPPEPTYFTIVITLLNMLVGHANMLAWMFVNYTFRRKENTNQETTQ